MRSVASIAASVMLIAASAVTWYGVVAIVLFAVLLIDLQRRVSHVLGQMDSVNDRLDKQKHDITSLRDLVANGNGDDGN